MALTSGVMLGPYAILGPAGGGGMGEVYRARDTRLQRIVALKVLRADLLADPVAAQRLQREARAVAALSHPHICPLFDVGLHDGTTFLVMEYLEGETLASRLSRGKLPLEQALTVGSQIADALAAAHKAGIVHRDLKPGNVMLTKTGAKLLDFGLARPAAVSPAGPVLETVTRAEPTAAGMVVGTWPFMAPEQLEGRAVDARTDIWAFGCVLHEMVTGARAFDGTTPVSIAASILEREPPRLADVEPAARPLDRIARKCLARDPDDRWQSAADLRDELRWIASGGLAADATPTRRSPWRDRLAGAAIAAVALLAAIAGLAPWRSRPSADPALQRLELSLPRLSALESIRLSPDGRHLAFVAPGANGTPALWVRSLALPTPRVLSDLVASPECPPIWSPDGEWIAFIAERKLRRIPLVGGETQVIADIPGQAYGGSWGRDGTILLGVYQFSATHGVHRVAAAGGTLVPVTPLGPDALLQALPTFLPDGRRFVFLTWGPDDQQRDACVGSLDAPDDVRCLGVRSHMLGGVAEGHLLYTRRGTLFAHPFDVASATVSGNPVVVAERVAADGVGRSGVSVAARGVLAYQPALPELRQLVWVDRDGRVLGALGETGLQTGLSASADGRLAIVLRHTEAATGTWLVDAATKVTTMVLGEAQAVLSPDGTTLAFARRRDGAVQIVERGIRGGPETIKFEHAGPGLIAVVNRSAGGDILVGIAEPSRRVLAVLRDGGDRTVPLADGPVSFESAAASPDGRWVAYSSGVSGRTEVYVTPLAGTGERWQVSAEGGHFPAWRGDGTELFYLALDGTLMAAAVRAGAEFDVAPPVALFESDPAAQRFAVSPDGQRFLFNRLREGDQRATTTTLHVILNWPGLLTR